MSVNGISANNAYYPYGTWMSSSQSSSNPPQTPSISTTPQQDTVTITGQAGQQPASSSGSNSILQDLQNLSNDFKSGDFNAAEKDIASLKQDFQNIGGHRHHSRHHRDSDKDGDSNGSNSNSASDSSSNAGVTATTSLSVFVVGIMVSTSQASPSSSNNSGSTTTIGTGTSQTGSLVNVTA